MKIFKYIFYLFISFMILSCDIQEEKLVVEVYETSKDGNKLTKLENYSEEVNSNQLSKVVLKTTEEKSFSKPLIIDKVAHIFYIVKKDIVAVMDHMKSIGITKILIAGTCYGGYILSEVTKEFELVAGFVYAWIVGALEWE